MCSVTDILQCNAGFKEHQYNRHLAIPNMTLGYTEHDPWLPYYAYQHIWHCTHDSL